MLAKVFLSYACFKLSNKTTEVSRVEPDSPTRREIPACIVINSIFKAEPSSNEYLCLVMGFLSYKPKRREGEGTIWPVT